MNSILKDITKIKLPEISEKEFNKFLFRDKKVQKNKLNLILLDKQCSPIIKNDIETEIIYKIYIIFKYCYIFIIFINCIL